MRPIKLTISGFGPYAKEQVIPMEQLGEAGLYLVTGDTGAGKTTIFDAITYALYGEASGEHRENSMFRSKYADKETVSFVELEFLLRGKRYIVNRIPEYERPRKKGEGTTKQHAEATLKLPDGEVPVTRPTEVTKKIVSLLGLDRKQFTQLAMVAQGEFLKLLFAKTEERSKIFREIFKTAPYVSLQEMIKKEANGLNRVWEDERKTLYHHIDQVCVKNGDAMEEELQDMKKNKASYLIQDVVSVIGKIIEKDRAEKERLFVQLKELERALEQVNEKLGVGKNLQNAKKEYEENKVKLEEEQKRYLICEGNFNNSKKKGLRKDELVVLIENMKQKLGAYEEWEQLQKKLSKLQDNINKEENRLAEEAKDEAKMKEQLSRQKEQIEHLRDADVKRVSYEEQLQRMLEKRTRLKKLSDKNQEYVKKQTILEGKQAEFLKVNESYLLQAEKYQKIEQLFFKEQAGILADKLEENSPCPVCGSLHHPNLAPLLPDAPSEETVKQEKTDLESCRAVVEAVTMEVNGYAKELEVLKAEILERAKEILGISNWEEIKEAGTKYAGQIQTEIAEMKKQVEVYQKKELEKKQLETSIVSLEEKITKLLEQKNAGEKLLVEQNSQLNSLKEKQETMEKMMEYASAEEAKKAIFQLEREKLDIEKEQKQCEEAYTISGQKIVSYEAKLTELKKLVEQSEDIALEELQQKQTSLRKEKEEKEKQKEEVTVRISKNTGAESAISTQREKISHIEEKMTWMKALSDTANGTVAGKDKIMLETYIQMQYFERVLQRANVRFMNMSSGQYELQRRAEADNQRSQSGLELDVLDHYNGSLRSVKTLSGGEAFQASLSLALGLADEVRECAGGIQIDTLFVDEGFGSLDDEALNQAIKTLQGLAEGNRLVGIISHVSELKSRIDRQLVVEKDREQGSRVRVVT